MAPSRKKAPAKKAARGTTLIVCTRKGLWFYESDPKRKTWKVDGPHFFGCVVHHAVLDPRDEKTILAAVRTGHLGPTLYRTTNRGKKWEELTPPKFAAGATIPGQPEKKRVVEHVFWLEPGHASQKGTWYAGTSPAALFKSTDNGATWEPNTAFNDGPQAAEWLIGDGTPDGQTLHSVNVDPRDHRVIYVSCSGGGTFFTEDEGASWKPLNRGVAMDFAPKEVAAKAEFGHDPHCVRLHPLRPDRLYRQDHCGIYRLDRPNDRWVRIGDNMPRSIKDIGFPIVLHPRDPDTAWVFPMDGGTVWPRVSPGGKAAAYRTRNAGKTWQRQDAGLPQTQAWFTVKRQAFSADRQDPVGLYFGNTAGEVWASTNEGEKWTCIARHLPHIYSVTTA